MSVVMQEANVLAAQLASSQPLTKNQKRRCSARLVPVLAASLLARCPLSDLCDELVFAWS